MRVLIAVCFSFLLPISCAAAPKSKQPAKLPARSQPAPRASQAAPPIGNLAAVQKPGSESVRVLFDLARPSAAVVRILTRPEAGAPDRPAKTIQVQPNASGHCEALWDGTDESGQHVLGTAAAVAVRVIAGGNTASLVFKPCRHSHGGAQQTALIIPQLNGNVFKPGEAMNVGVQFHNSASSSRDFQVSCSAAGSVASASLRLAPQECGAVSVPLKAPSAPGPLKVTATVASAGKQIAQATTTAFVMPPAPLAKGAEPIFGLIGTDNLALAQAIGAGVWISGKPWWMLPGEGPLRQSADPDSPDAFVNSASKSGISLVGVASMPLDASPGLRDAVSHFIRRVGGWLLPTPTDGDYTEALRRFYAAVKAVHKDAWAFMNPLPAPQCADIAKQGAATDAIVFEGDADGRRVDEVASARDFGSPGRELWVVLGNPAKLNAAEALRSAVANIAHGADRILWNGTGLLADDSGTPSPALFGCALAAQLLTGAEYAGCLDSGGQVHAHVFHKGGSSIVVAWSESASASIDLPGAGGKSTSVKQVTPAGVQTLPSKRSVSVGSHPIVVEGVSASVTSKAASSEMKARFGRASAAAAEAGIPFPTGDFGDEQVSELLSLAVDKYTSDESSRGKLVTFICRLEQVADLLALRKAVASQSSETASRRALDVLNHAIADLRAPIVLKEGSKGFLPHARALLRQVEKRASAALAAYKQGDHSLAEAKANQATALAKAVLKVVSAEPVMDLSQP
jgi:hypothetical protein